VNRMDHAGHPSRTDFNRLRITLGLRHVGLILPMLVNYGHLLLSGGDYHWGPVTLSVGTALVCVALLLERGDRRGARWIAVLFWPLNAWPVAATALSEFV